MGTSKKSGYAAFFIAVDFRGVLEFGFKNRRLSLT